MVKVPQGTTDRWQLAHERLGTWFIPQYGGATEVPKVRLQLVRLGAIPLPAGASPAEVQQWLTWMQQEDYEHYQSLPYELQVSVCESLLTYLPDHSAERALVIAQLAGIFLIGTGEQQRGFALEAALEQALQQPTVPAAIQAEVLVSLGDIQENLGRLDKALEYFKRYLAIREQLLKEADSPRNRRGVAEALNRLGGIYEAQQDLPRALDYYQRSLELREQLQAESPTPQTRRDLAVSYDRLGAIYEAQQDLPRALDYYQRDLEISTQLQAKSPTPQTRRDLAVSYGRLGAIYEAQQDLARALDYFQRYQELCEQLQAESPTPQTRRDLAVSYNRLGVWYFRQDQFDQARPYFEKYLQLAEELLAMADVPQYRREVENAREWLQSTEEAQRRELERRQDKSRAGRPGWWERVKRWMGLGR